MTQPSTEATVPAPRRPRHLLDPDNPRPQDRRRAELSLSRVQKWVLSTLAVSTIMHFAIGLNVAALYVPESRTDARIGLNVLAGVTALLAVAAGLAIHGKRPLSWWLLLGVLPVSVGLFLTFAA